MAGHFRSTVWDPSLLIAQIICLQAIYYLSLGIWVLGVDLLVGHEYGLDQIFAYKSIHVVTWPARGLIAAFILNSLTCAVGLWWVVTRTKQCLDFSVTAHLLHFFACWIVSGQLPSTISWWLLIVTSATIMTVVAEYLCMRTEMKAIPLSSMNRADL